MLTCVCLISPVSPELLEEGAVSSSALYPWRSLVQHLVSSLLSCLPSTCHQSVILGISCDRSCPSPVQALVCFPVAQIPKPSIQGFQILAPTNLFIFSHQEGEGSSDSTVTLTVMLKSLPLLLLVPGLTYFPPVSV